MSRQDLINGLAAVVVMLVSGGSSIANNNAAGEIAADIRAMRQDLSATVTTVAVIENRVTQLEEKNHGSK